LALSRLFVPLRLRAEEEAASLPALLARAEKAAASIASGEHAQRRPGTGEKFWQYREYDPSDRPQDIDWRQSAKGDRVFIREKERQTPQTALFWCQDNASMEYASRPAAATKRDAAQVICTALAILMTRAGEHVGLLEGGARPGRTELAVERLGAHFLSGNETGLLPDPRALKFPGRAALFLAADFLAPLPQAEAALSALAARAGSLILIQVLDPAEIEFPFSGRVIFTDPADAGRYPVENAQAVAAPYRARMEAHLKGLDDICRRTGARRILHRTDGSVAATLLEAWRLISPETVHAAGGRV
jgi:uncharacterized protein (DUF58 family)